MRRSVLLARTLVTGLVVAAMMFATALLTVVVTLATAVRTVAATMMRTPAGRLVTAFGTGLLRSAVIAILLACALSWTVATILTWFATARGTIALVAVVAWATAIAAFGMTALLA